MSAIALHLWITTPLFVGPLRALLVWKGGYVRSLEQVQRVVEFQAGEDGTNELFVEVYRPGESIAQGNGHNLTLPARGVSVAAGDWTSRVPFDAADTPALACQACAAPLSSNHDRDAINLVCPTCDHANPHLAPIIARLLDISHVPPDVSADRLEKALHCYSWCNACESITRNVPGTTHGRNPFDDPSNAGVFYDNLLKRRLTPEDDGTSLALCTLRVQSMMVVPSAAKFFACQNCGGEKFWEYGYHCPHCDSPHSALVGMSATRPVTGEYSGLEWDETRVCLVCELQFEYENANV